MDEIIDQINSSIESCFSGSVLTYGLCHLVQDTNEQYPSTKLKDGVKVTPSDEHDLVVYHRLLNSEFEESEELSFGRKKNFIPNQGIRTVLIFDLEEEFTPEDIANSLPDEIQMSGFRFVNVSKNMTLNRDSNAVWEDEYSDDYKDKYVKRYNIYALEYQINYSKCAVC